MGKKKLGGSGAVGNEKQEFISRQKHVNISFTFLATQNSLVCMWQMISNALWFAMGTSARVVAMAFKCYFVFFVKDNKLGKNNTPWLDMERHKTQWYFLTPLIILSHLWPVIKSKNRSYDEHMFLFKHASSPMVASSLPARVNW